MAFTVPEASITAMLAREEALFIQRNPMSKRLGADAAKNWLKGVPMHWMVDWGMPFPLFVSKAQGVDVTDADGNTYIDFCLGDTGAMFGHSPKPIVEALQREAANGFPVDWTRIPPDLRRALARPAYPRARKRPPVATTNDLKNGLVLNIDGQLWAVIEFQHVKPGKGPAFVRTKLKNVLSGKVVDRTFNAGVKVETANVDKRTMQYLYKDGSDFVFMDTDTYDQLHVSEAVVAGGADYLLENQNAIVATHDGVPLYVELPASVVLEITFTEPGLQGDRSTGGTKPATLETGAQIQVPLFLESGTRVKVDTRDGSYLGRVND